jgi:hypothetical protein
MAITKLIADSITSGAIGNSPAFSVLLSSNQSISDNTLTKVNFNSEQYDTNNAYDNSSNYRFTVPSSLGGKYNFTTTCALDGTSHNTIHYTILHFYKNGSSIGSVTDNGEQGYQRTHVMNYSVGLTLSPSDYIEVYALIRTFGTTPRVNASSSFMGYKIIE